MHSWRRTGGHCHGGDLGEWIALVEERDRVWVKASVGRLAACLVRQVVGPPAKQDSPAPDKLTLSEESDGPLQVRTMNRRKYCSTSSSRWRRSLDAST